VARTMKLRLAHLYPRLMNIYGDRGNILCFQHRCRARGIVLQVEELEPGDKLNWKDFDIIFMGGAQDRQQQQVAEDLEKVKGKALKEAAEQGVVILAVCGGYQLMGRFYRAADQSELPGAGILDLHTEHPGADAERFIGNVVARWNGTTLVGFENHGGRTYLGERAEPLAQIVSGFGNNGRDISWIWDVDFEILHGWTSRVTVSGTRAWDLALRLKYAGLEPVCSVEKDASRALKQAIRQTPENGALHVIPTYTAMLEVREMLAEWAGRNPFWDEE